MGLSHVSMCEGNVLEYSQVQEATQLDFKVSPTINLHIHRLYMIFTVFWNSTGISTAMSW